MKFILFCIGALTANAEITASRLKIEMENGSLAQEQAKILNHVFEMKEKANPARRLKGKGQVYGKSEGSSGEQQYGWNGGSSGEQQGGWNGGSSGEQQGGWNGGSSEGEKGGWNGGSSEGEKGGWNGGSSEGEKGGWDSGCSSGSTGKWGWAGGNGCEFIMINADDKSEVLSGEDDDTAIQFKGKCVSVVGFRREYDSSDQVACTNSMCAGGAEIATVIRGENAGKGVCKMDVTILTLDDSLDVGDSEEYNFWCPHLTDNIHISCSGNPFEADDECSVNVEAVGAFGLIRHDPQNDSSDQQKCDPGLIDCHILCTPDYTWGL